MQVDPSPVSGYRATGRDALVPTVQNPVDDADEAREALRGLAYATRHFDRDEDIYPVLGALTHSVEALQQVLNQLAAWHLTDRPRAATDSGDRAAGIAEAVAAAASLKQAAISLDRVWEGVNRAWSHNGAIAWQPDVLTPDTPANRAPSASRRQESTTIAVTISLDRGHGIGR